MLTVCTAGTCDGTGNNNISVTGTLKRIMAVGGETTGWAINLDRPLVFQGKEYKRLDVAPGGVNISDLSGKKITASGAISWRTGVERGRYPVLELTGFKEIK
ncbi:MAG: hypothetical protein ABSG42_07040 [Nitrospirota bacterium]